MLVDGSVWAFGGNKDGQIGNGLTQAQYKPTKLKLKSIRAISAWHASAALNKHGELYMWGTVGCMVPTKM